MDFIVSYHLYSKLKRKENKNIELQVEEETKPIIKTCHLCGQNIYFCQCKNNKYKRNFNPEKDIY
tara:strand:- start:685 stop:879 length:195 start_codon:yes stop_codon:yes gene_type:complete